mgnify:CR=1 FL=1
MKQRFSFEFDWLSHELGDAIERCTAANVGIRVGDLYFTELEDMAAKTVRRWMRVSANTLALWLAGNWWRLRWEPERRESVSDWRMSHCIAAAGGGYVWPSLFFCSDGYTVRLDSKVSECCNFPVHYLRGATKTMSARDFEAGVDSFIGAVIARLIANNIHDAELIALWRDVQQERHDPALAAYRKMEALLGFDADECPDEIIQKLDALAGQYGRSSIEEMAAAGDSDTILYEIDELVTQGQSIAQPITIPSCTDIRIRMKEKNARQHAQPWQRAEAVAEIVRNAWDIGPRDPISTETFSNVVELDPAFLATSGEEKDALPMSVGFRSQERQDSMLVALHRKPITSRRFALARIIGDYFYTVPEDRFLPATNAATVRQKFQRAFAQELLCPYEALISIVGEHPSDDDAIEDAAVMFEVSPLLVKTTLVNKGVLERECLS